MCGVSASNNFEFATLADVARHQEEFQPYRCCTKTELHGYHGWIFGYCWSCGCEFLHGVVLGTLKPALQPDP